MPDFEHFLDSMEQAALAENAIGKFSTPERCEQLISKREIWRMKLDGDMLLYRDFYKNEYVPYVINARLMPDWKKVVDAAIQTAGDNLSYLEAIAMLATERGWPMKTKDLLGIIQKYAPEGVELPSRQNLDYVFWNTRGKKFPDWPVEAPSTTIFLGVMEVARAIDSYIPDRNEGTTPH